eukprot:99715-Rhodomonas_salina.2
MPKQQPHCHSSEDHHADPTPVHSSDDPTPVACALQNHWRGGSARTAKVKGRRLLESGDPVGSQRDDDALAS